MAPVSDIAGPARRFLRCAALGLALAIAAPVAPVPALAQEAPLPPAVAAVIDYQRILRDSRAARSVREQVEARRQRYQDQIAKEEQRLHEADKELARQRTVLSAEALAEKRKAFDADVAEVQRMVQARRRQLDEVSAAALTEVRNAIIQVVGQLAERYGFNIVVPSSGVLLFSPRIDLTEQVLAQLDETLPDVRVPEQVPGQP